MFRRKNYEGMESFAGGGGGTGQTIGTLFFQFPNFRTTTNNQTHSKMDQTRCILPKWQLLCDFVCDIVKQIWISCGYLTENEYPSRTQLSVCPFIFSPFFPIWDMKMVLCVGSWGCGSSPDGYPSFLIEWIFCWIEYSQFQSFDLNGWIEFVRKQYFSSKYLYYWTIFSQNKKFWTWMEFLDFFWTNSAV